MPARLNDRDLERVLDAWMEEGPMTAAESTIDQVMARIPTARQRGGFGRGLQLPRLLRTQGPVLASMLVLVTLLAGLALAIGTITRPVPAPSPPPVASDAASEPSPSASAEETPRPVRARGSFEMTTPVGSIPGGRTWVFSVQEYEPLRGFRFSYGCCGAKEYYVTLFVDPLGTYAGTLGTEREGLGVLIGIQDIASRTNGSFASELGECQFAFEEFGTTSAQGTLTCANVPGTYARGDETGLEGQVSLSGEFTFDPFACPAGEPSCVWESQRPED
jgi:hypothetical protein